MDSNSELIKQVTAKAKGWLSDGYDAETQAEVKRMLDADDKTELIESFYKISSSAPVVCAASWEQAPTA